MTYLTPSMIASRQRSIKKSIEKKKAERMAKKVIYLSLDEVFEKMKEAVLKKRTGKPPNARSQKVGVRSNKPEISANSPKSVKNSGVKRALKVISRNWGWFVKELDKVFSIYIRKRDADSNGMVKCFTCPRIDHWSKMQNSHYYSRRYMSLRFSEKNCHAACPKCNLWMEGNRPEYTLALIKKYGEGILQELEIKKNNISKLGIWELKYLIAEYEEKNALK